MGNENKKQALPEKQALTNEAVSAIPDDDNIATGGLKLDWKKGAKIAAATALGATAIGGAAIGGKKLYDSHKKNEPIYMDDKGIGHDAPSTAKSIDDVD